MQFLQLGIAGAAGGTGHQAAGLLGLGEGNCVADRILPGQQHHQTINAEGDAAVGGSPHLQGLQQETELFFGFLLGQADGLEHLALQLGVMDAQGAAP